MTEKRNNASNVPTLRFPGFSDDWNSVRLGNTCEINPKSESLPNSFVYIDLESVSSGVLLKEEVVFKSNAPSRAQRLLKKGDVLFQMVRPYQKNNLFFNLEGDYVGSTGYAQLRTKFSSEFLFQYLQTQKFVDKVIERCTGTSYPAINSTDLSNIGISLPSLEEQKKIATFLSLIDARIQTQNKIIEQLESLIKAITENLFKQQLFFKSKGNQKFLQWEKKKLSAICHEHKLKNTKNDYNEVFSVAKHKGVINQIEHLGRSFSAKEISHYKLIFPGDLVYTKSPTSDFPFGIIKQNRTERVGVVSPLYCVFKPLTFALGYLIHEYFKSSVNTYNYLSPLVQKGAKNTMNINNEDFLNGAKLLLPMDEDEQSEIANFLILFDKKIELEKKILDQLEKKKKFLLANFFI